MALAENASLDRRNDRSMKRHSTVVKTSAIIYQNALVVVDITAGTSLPAANTTTTLFIGMAIEASTGLFPLTGDGTVTVTTITDLEINLPLKTVVTQGNVLGAIYAFDDADGTDLATLGPVIGTLQEFVAANDGWVWIAHTALGAAS